MKRNYLSKGLALVFCLLMLSVANVMAQIDYCEGDFDADGDQDGTDAFTFKTDFGRSSFSNPCPPGVSCGGILKTGQTGCWDMDGNPISCAGTGQDGEYQIGYSRFTDHEDGTVTDNSTGLMWYKNGNAGLIPMNWDEALFLCTVFINSGEGAYGYTDWRLPNVRELKSLYDSISYDDGMPMEPHPFTNVMYGEVYWSSTTREALPWDVYTLYFSAPGLAFNFKTSNFYVWPVRGGH